MTENPRRRDRTDLGSEYESELPERFPEVDRRDGGE